VLRRLENDSAGAVVTVGGLVIDEAARTVTLDAEPVELTRKEFDLLAYLAQHAGEVVSKRDLLAEVWRQPFGGADKTVDVHLSWLRRKLGESAAEPRYLHTVRGVGIRLAAP
jgi:DNA-binding response OmpR family regulator